MDKTSVHNARKMFHLAGFIVCMTLLYNGILPVFKDKSTEAVSKEYRDFERGTFDVILLGSSVMMNDVYPLQLYDEYGISAYNLGSGNQRLPMTYYLVEETLKEQDPKLVVIDVLTCWDNNAMCSDGITHFVTDAMRFPEKAELIFDIIPREKQMDFFFEMGTYHTRWESLSQKDFEKAPAGRLGTYGAKVWYGGKPIETLGEITTQKEELPEIPEKYLRETIELCQENNTEVLLTLMPINYSGTADRIRWQGYWNMKQDIADEYDINYLNFMYRYDEVGIDITCDLDDMDGGLHLNAHGAEKLTAYLGRYITENYELEDVREDPSYDFMREDLETFQGYKTELALKSTTSLSDYLDLLTNYRSDRYTIFVSVKDIQGYALTQDVIEKMINLGYEGGGILLDKQYHSFIGVIHGAKVVEMYGDDEALFYDGEINKRKFYLSSRTLEHGNLSEIKIGAKDYSQNRRGLNFVLYDNQAEKVIDAVSFDTHVPEFTCIR